MPDPISSTNSNGANSSYYDPSDCDPSRASCMPAVPPPVVTLEPVLIEGEAPRKPPECVRERNIAIATCSLGAAALVAGVIERGLSLSSLLSGVNHGQSCAKLISDYDNCKKDGAERTAAANRCEADGGVAVAGIEKHEVVCLKLP